MTPARTRDEALITQMRRGTLQFCVLALLSDEPRYAFDVVRSLGEVDGMVTSEGTIYPLLSRLRREGMVASTWQESPSGPPRRYYVLTDVGHASLQRFTTDWRTFRDAVDHLISGEAT